MNRIKLLAIRLIAFASKNNAQTAPFQIAILPINNQ